MRGDENVEFREVEQGSDHLFGFEELGLDLEGERVCDFDCSIL